MAMDHREIDDHQVRERYVLGKLSAEETERFEDHLLECRECLERLEEAERFQTALREVVAEDAARAVVRAGVLAGLKRLGRWPGLALAAVLALALLLPSGVLTRRLDRLRDENGRLRTDLEQALAPRLGPPLLRLGPARGRPGEGRAPNRITVTSQPEWIVLVLEVGAGAGVCRVRLDGPDEAAVWSDDSAPLDASGDVVLTLHSTTLEEGDHVLEVTCPSPEGRGEHRTPFSFRVVRER
jgi:hypothetical protein